MNSFADLLQYVLASFQNMSPPTILDVPATSSAAVRSEENVPYENNCDGFAFNTSSSIGSGGYGQIYKGKYMQCDVAIKVTNRRDMFHREYVALARAQSHVCIVNLVGVQEEHMWIAMELATGDLFTHVCDTRPDESTARNFFSQMLSALEHLHARSVVHRDVKLENWLTFSNGRIKLTDFGLSYTYADERRHDNINGFVGSISYCAPEILSRTVYNGFLLDSWSVTVCLFAMVTGFFPLDEASHRDWRYARIFSTHTDDIATAIFGLYSQPCTLSKNLRGLIHKVFSSRSFDRPPIRELQKHPWMQIEDVLDEVVVDRTVWRSCTRLVEDSTPRLCRVAATRFNREGL